MSASHSSGPSVQQPRTVSSWTELPLWQHQRGAINMIHQYLDRSAERSALIRMPTGTGKTAVIGVVAQCFDQCKDILVVAPWVHLIDQLTNEIETALWFKLRARPAAATKLVWNLFPSNLDRLLGETRGQPSIFISTYQSLAKLHSTDDAGYRALRKRLDVVLVDEGHREPAPKWARAVRGLAKPVILLTATPYRNDLRAFRINPDYVFRFQHQDAVRKRFIRAVGFREVETSGSPALFVDRLLDFMDGEFKDLRPSAVSEPRVIVRCNSSEEIKQVQEKLVQRVGRQAVIAVHETFGDEDEARFHRVPRPDESDATFWIHQFKLIEGLDDPRFCLLALFRPIAGGTRALVQQIGRIVRNPRRPAGQTAYVLSDLESGQQKRWLAYLAYERMMVKPAPTDLLQDLLDVHPAAAYVAGTYRAKFDPDASDFYLHLLYRPVTSVFETNSGFDIPKLIESIEDTLEKEEISIRGHYSGPATHVFVHSRIASSPLLHDQVFFETSLGYTIIHQAEGYLFWRFTVLCG